MTAYFERLDDATFRATNAVQGAWNTSEQHVAPALGVLAHLIEVDHRARRSDRMQLARVSYDILGVLPIEEVTVETRVLRAGRTIELVEATLSHDGRPAVIARAWWMQQTCTASFAGSGLPSMPSRGELPEWSMTEEWPGEFLTTLEARRRLLEPGRAWAWVRSQASLIADETVSTTARTFGLIDTTNGVATRVLPDDVLFPNLDLTVHLLREPLGEWVGFDTTVSFGASGLGLTNTVLHDEIGPIGTAAQTLTVRPWRTAARR